MPYTPDQLYVFRCPCCFETISIPASEIPAVPHDHLQCSRCFETFCVSKLDDVIKLPLVDENAEEIDWRSSTILRNLEKDINYYNPDQQYILTCPNCYMHISMPKSEIRAAPNDYLGCPCCGYVFKVSSNDSNSIYNLDPLELERCKGLIPTMQEIDEIKYSQKE